MRNALLIAAREYIENVKTKGFWISILVLPIILSFTIVVPRLLEDKAIPTRHFAVIDPNDILKDHIKRAVDQTHASRVFSALKEYLNEHSLSHKLDTAMSRLAQWNSGPLDEREPFDTSEFVSKEAPEFESPREKFRLIELPDIDTDENKTTNSIDEVRQFLNGKKILKNNGTPIELFAAFIIKEEEGGSQGKVSKIEYWSTNPSEESIKNLVEQTANLRARRKALTNQGLNPDDIEKTMQIRIPILEFDARKEQGSEKVQISDKIKQWAPSAFVYLLFLSLMTVMQMILNSTIEEKSNRLLEILLSSVKPIEIMIGKLLGNGLAGMTLIGIWILLMAGFTLTTMDSNSEVLQGVSSVVSGTILLPAFLVYFVLGFLVYSGIFLMIGSTCQTIKDAQSYVGFLMVIMIVPLVTMVFIPRDPNGTLATTLSWVPIFTPFIMLNRLSGQPPIHEIIGTFIFSCATIMIILNIAAKVFKKSIIANGASSNKRNSDQ